MAYYYVKTLGAVVGLADGTDSGRFATQQTGSFATLTTANFYSSVSAAFAATTPPTKGDFICVSNVHDYTVIASIQYTGVAENLFYILSVEDLNINLSSTTTRAKETALGGPSDLNLIDVCVSGMEFAIGDNCSIGNSWLSGCLLTMVADGNAINFSGASDGSAGTAINCEFAINATTSNFSIQSGSSMNIEGGSVTTTTAGIDHLTQGGFGLGGGIVRINGTDLSAVTGTLIADVGSSEGDDDTIDVRITNSKIATGVAFANETFKSYNQRAEFIGCSDSSAAAEYQYHLHAFGGNVSDDSSAFRNEDPAFNEAGQKMSYEITTNSDASIGAPLWFDLPIKRWAELSTKTLLTFYLTSDSVLTDKDIYPSVRYADSVNKQSFNVENSAPKSVGGVLDLLAVGTTLTVDAVSTYTGGLTFKYKIEIETSGNLGADCVPLVRITTTKPSVIINLSSIYDVT